MEIKRRRFKEVLLPKDTKDKIALLSSLCTLLSHPCYVYR